MAQCYQAPTYTLLISFFCVTSLQCCVTCLVRITVAGWLVILFQLEKNDGIIVATYDMENGVNYLTTRLNFGLPLLVHLKCLYHHGFTKSRRIYYFDALIAILA